MAFDVSQVSSQVRQFTDWANQAASDKALVGLKPSVLEPGPLSKSVKTNALKGAIDKFKAALADAVGETLASRAWKAAGGENCKGLSAGLIKKTAEEVGKLFDQLGVGSVMKELSKLDKSVKNLADITREEVFGTVTRDVATEKSVRAQIRASAVIARANSLLGRTPSSEEEVGVLLSAARDVHGKLQACKTELTKTYGFAMDSPIVCLIETKLGQVGEKRSVGRREFTAMLGGQSALPKLADTWKRSIGRVCTAMMEATTNDKQKVALSKKLAAFLDKYTNEAIVEKLKSNKSNFFNGSVLKFAFGSFFKLENQFGKELSDLYKSVCGSKKLPDGTSLTKLVEKCHDDELNMAEWRPIRNEFVGTLKGQTMKLESSITSGRRIDEQGIGSQYDPKVNAYNCNVRNTDNAVNLATSELAVDGETVFRGVRHGVHSAKKVHGMTDAQANIRRAKQTATAAFIEYLKMNPSCVNDGPPIKFNMTSVSLLTPVGITKENKMLTAQKAAWDAINAMTGGFEVRVGENTYTIRPKVTTFNYGVNTGAVNMKGEPSNGWGASGVLNGPAMAQLDRRVSAFMADKGNLKVRQAVFDLYHQIRDIRENKAERTDGHEAYKMASRLAVISYLMGDVPVWNCKSGKDRTGMLDVEVKFLSTLIAKGQEIPRPGQELTDEQKELFNTIARKAGNLEMQEYNTGAAGYKLTGVDSVFERTGASGGSKETLLGGSAYIGS